MIVWISPGWPSGRRNGSFLSPDQQRALFEQVRRIATGMRRDDIVIDNLDPLGVQENVAATTYYKAFLGAVQRPEDAQYGNLSLGVVATESGGLVLHGNDISGMLARCVQDAGSFYRITFKALPAAKDDPFHTVRVVVNRPGVETRTRNGYYAGP